MESKSFIKLLRRIIREEVGAAVKRVLNEQKTDHQQVMNHGLDLQRMTEQPKRQKRQKRRFTKNSMLNDLLNETGTIPGDGPLVTQGAGDYASMGSAPGTNTDTAESFGFSRQPQALATTDHNGAPVNMQNEQVAKTVGAMTKDYRSLMKAIDKKKGR